MLRRLTLQSSLMWRALSSAASLKSPAKILSSTLVGTQERQVSSCHCKFPKRPGMSSGDCEETVWSSKLQQPSPKAGTHEGPAWDYDKHGPEYWLKVFPDGCGSHQSPINIDTMASYVRYDKSLGPIELDYSRCKLSAVFNSGHSFQVNVAPDSPAILTGGPLTGKYQLVQFHGHWGASNSVHGSEHTINNRAYPSELHFVHFNKDKYPSVKEAVKHPDGLSVIGVFIKVDKNERPHPEIEKLLECMKDITYTGAEMPLKVSFDPRKLLPERLERYFTYPGSLTTPPLSQCITWIMLPEQIGVSSKQLQPFRRLQNPHNKHVIDHNYRPVMPINDRMVRASWEGYNDPSLDGPIPAFTTTI